MSGASNSLGCWALRLLLLLGATGTWSAAMSGGDVNSEGRHLFLTGATPSCAPCHTLVDAGSSGEIGPALDKIKPDAARVEKAVRYGLGVMPANTSLSDAQIKLLAEYVARVTGGVAK